MSDNPNYYQKKADNLSDLIARLKQMDMRNSREILRWLWIFGILAGLFIILMVLDAELFMIIDIICLLGLFTLYRVYYLQLIHKDYSVSVKQQLKRASQSYRFFNRYFIISAVFAFPLIAVGFNTLFTRYIPVSILGLGQEPSNILLASIFFIVVLIIAYFVWRRKSAGIFKEIRQNLIELDT